MSAGREGIEWLSAGREGIEWLSAGREGIEWLSAVSNLSYLLHSSRELTDHEPGQFLVHLSNNNSIFSVCHLRPLSIEDEVNSILQARLARPTLLLVVVVSYVAHWELRVERTE